MLLAIANGTPVMAETLLGRFLSYPLDAGKTFIDGRRLFGSSKTIRGIVVAVVATSACAPVLGVTWPAGSLIGVAAMAGDLTSSLIKRRMGVLRAAELWASIRFRSHCSQHSPARVPWRSLLPM